MLSFGAILCFAFNSSYGGQSTKWNAMCITIQLKMLCILCKNVKWSPTSPEYICGTYEGGLWTPKAIWVNLRNLPVAIVTCGRENLVAISDEHGYKESPMMRSAVLTSSIISLLFSNESQYWLWSSISSRSTAKRLFFLCGAKEEIRERSFSSNLNTWVWGLPMANFSESPTRRLTCCNKWSNRYERRQWKRTKCLSFSKWKEWAQLETWVCLTFS